MSDIEDLSGVVGELCAAVSWLHSEFDNEDRRNRVHAQINGLEWALVNASREASRSHAYFLSGVLLVLGLLDKVPSLCPAENPVKMCSEQMPSVVWRLKGFAAVRWLCTTPATGMWELLKRIPWTTICAHKLQRTSLSVVFDHSTAMSCTTSQLTCLCLDSLD